MHKDNYKSSSLKYKRPDCKSEMKKVLYTLSKIQDAFLTN